MKVNMRFGYRALRWAALSGVLSLALMVWGVLDPRPIALVVAMTAGQALGTAAFAVFLLVVLNDLRRARVFSRRPGNLSEAPEAAHDEQR
jgi:hypothetical protein